MKVLLQVEKSEGEGRMWQMIWSWNKCDVEDWVRLGLKFSTVG